MKILIIANNIEGNHDGIGKHARIVGHEIKDMGHEVEYCSGTTWNKGKAGKILSVQMIRAFISATIKMLKDNYDYIIVEYPFAEYNPFVLFFHWLLFILSRFTETRIAFSMHEYDRVSPLRRMIIDGFLPFCDILFVTENKYFKELSKFSSKMHVRTLASQGLPFIQGLKDYSRKNSYCYFGLVNKSKAFQKMLDAWDKFNDRGLYTLDVVSNTDLTEFQLEQHRGITYYCQLSDQDAGKVLSKDVFAIIPVVPAIGFNNSSFVTFSQCGCIPIGKFNSDLKEEPFLIHCKSYDLLDFCDALQESQKIQADELKKLSSMAVEFGKNFSVHKTAEMMMNGFKAYESKHKK